MDFPRPVDLAVRFNKNNNNGLLPYYGGADRVGTGLEPHSISYINSLTLVEDLRPPMSQRQTLT